MFSSSPNTFAQRSRSVTRRARKLAKGSVTHVNAEGLMVARPRRHGLSIPWRGVALCALALTMFKALSISHLGLTRYGEQVTALQEGTLAERAAGWVMQADPVTRAIVAYIDGLPI